MFLEQGFYSFRREDIGCRIVWSETMEPMLVNEPIEILSKRFNDFPKSFLWRGQEHHVRAVDRCWTISRHNRLKAIRRQFFRVRTLNATYDLYRDLQRDTWYLNRVINNSG